MGNNTSIKSVPNPCSIKSYQPKAKKIRVQSVQSVFQNPIAAGEKIRV
jgi:hypothetical protein